LKEISSQIIEWFNINKRDLPWRQTTDPYLIWLSEVILQQTRVSQGMNYYLRFKEKFPNVQKLAQSSQREVLEVWQGLGYYSRGRNLHFAAQHIVNELNGVFPSNYKELLALKGIGDYTASAIASFAFHEDKAVVDGNVIRVISRLFKIETDTRNSGTLEQIKAIANELLPQGNSYLFNQGIMELGALICSPQKPECTSCPVSVHCVARREGLQSKIPFKSKLKAKRKRHFNYVLLIYKDELYFKIRGRKDIWEGLFEPILFEEEFSMLDAQDFIKKIQNSVQYRNIEIESAIVIPPQKHILTHQELWVGICTIQLLSKPDFIDGIWLPFDQFESLPKPIIISNLLKLKSKGQLTLSF
jgi:A/G-specific adenine glycosylase